MKCKWKFQKFRGAMLSSAVTSIYFLFGDQLIVPASVKPIHFVSKNDQERCRDQYDADDDGNGIDCTGESEVTFHIRCKRRRCRCDGA